MLWLLGGVIGLLVVAIAIPAIVAAHRKAWRLAVLAGVLGLLISASGIAWLTLSEMGHHDGFMFLFVGQPLISLAACIVLCRVVLAKTRRDTAHD